MRLRVGRESSRAFGHGVRTLRVVVVEEAHVKLDAVVARGGNKLAPCSGVPERRVVLVATLRIGEACASETGPSMTNLASCTVELVTILRQLVKMAFSFLARSWALPLMMIPSG